MSRRRSTFAVAALLTLLALPLAAARTTASDVRDLTPQFRAAGLAIPNLQVYEVGGLVLIRGTVATRALAEDAGRVARGLGYERIANLVKVQELPDDASIERIAERELAIHRSLDGCRFAVDSRRGVLHVNGHVQNEVQRDVAIAVLRNIDGVREVRAELATQ